jgi:Uma2 family endonuclease
MEVYKMLPEGTLAELIDGSLYMSPAPTTKHQRIIGEVFKKLSSFTESHRLGEVFLSPCDVFLDELSNAVQPDLIYVSSSKSKIVKEDAIHGVPDLLIEVLSTGNSQHDLVRKKDLYEKFGVVEYWVINPETKDCIGYSLDNGVYIECGRLIGKIVFRIFPYELEF